MKNNNNNNNNTNNNNNNNNIQPVDTPLENNIKIPEDIRSCYDVIFVSIVIIVIPPSSIPNKIKCFLYEFPGKSVFDISKAIKEDEDKTRTTIQRNKQLFKESGKDGGKILYSLDEVEKEKIDLLIKSYEQKQQHEIQQALEQKAKMKTEEEMIEELSKLISNKEVFIRDGNYINLDLNKLLEYDSEIFRALEELPEETLQLIETVFSNKGFDKLKLRFVNFDVIQNKTIEDLRSKDLNKLILLEAKSTSLSAVRPQIVNAKFECPSCGTVISVLQIEKKFREPSRCSCGRKGNFRLINKILVDVARVILEDAQDKIDSSFIKNITGYIKDTLTSSDEIKKFNPGNDLKVLGILKEIPIQLPTGAISTRLDHCFDILAAESFEPEISLEDFSDDEKKQYKDLSESYEKEGFNAINNSISPDIFGYTEIKNALILQSAQSKNNPSNPIRNKSGIFLIGDPGLTKSICLKFINDITQGSRYISASGSSQVGLTATVERSKNEGEWLLKPGVIPLSRELVIIDELNLLGEEERPKLQEAMSEQRITVNKASIHTELRVTCGFLTAGNPISGKFNPYEDIAKQFNLTPPILNRFDLIFALRDNVNEETDKEITKIMLKRERNQIKPKYDKKFLRRFFLFIRNQKDPVFNDDLIEYFADLYSTIRKHKDNNINPRFNETMIRLSKSSARLRLSEFVDKIDVDRAFEVFRSSFFGENLNKFMLEDKK